MEAGRGAQSTCICVQLPPIPGYLIIVVVGFAVAAPLRATLCPAQPRGAASNLQQNHVIPDYRFPGPTSTPRVRHIQPRNHQRPTSTPITQQTHLPVSSSHSSHGCVPILLPCAREPAHLAFNRTDNLAGRMHSGGRGISSSAIPYSRNPPSYVFYGPDRLNWC